MPGMNGRVLAERVTAALPNIRVLFVSGYTESIIVDRGVLKNGIEFLAKPYSLEQLSRRVREVLDAAARQ
jgi:CheY-like chemotaxis protein